MAVVSKLTGAVTYGCNNGGSRSAARAASRRQTSFDPTEGIRITRRRHGAGACQACFCIHLAEDTLPLELTPPRERIWR